MLESVPIPRESSVCNDCVNGILGLPLLTESTISMICVIKGCLNILG